MARSSSSSKGMLLSFLLAIHGLAAVSATAAVVKTGTTTTGEDEGPSCLNTGAKKGSAEGISSGGATTTNGLNLMQTASVQQKQPPAEPDFPATSSSSLEEEEEEEEEEEDPDLDSPDTDEELSLPQSRSTGPVLLEAGSRTSTETDTGVEAGRRRRRRRSAPMRRTIIDPKKIRAVEAGVKTNTAAIAKLKGEQEVTLENVAEMEGQVKEVAEDAKENVEEQEDLKEEMKGIANQLNALRKGI